MSKQKILAANPKIDFYDLWKFGDWVTLAQTEENENEDQIALKACAQLQLAQIEQAKATLKLLSNQTSEQTLRLLISGVFNSLGKAYGLLEKKKIAEKQFKKAIDIGLDSVNNKHIIQARKCEQLAQLTKSTRWIGLENLDRNGNNKKLFIDCGGHDGCSVIKFKLSNPDFDIVSFEGNPELWHYYDNLPTKLIKKIVSDYNGEAEFIIDPVDADGSSIIKEKNIDFYKNVKNEDCPVIVVSCIDLSEFVQEKTEQYQEIVLKLDVEGAEYTILNKMLQDGTLKHIKKLYAEFHWNKINLSEDEHNSLITKIQPYFKIEYWDAAEFQVHTKGASNRKIRQQILNAII